MEGMEGPVLGEGEMEQTSANPRSGGRDDMWVLGGPFLATCVLRRTPAVIAIACKLVF